MSKLSQEQIDSMSKMGEGIKTMFSSILTKIDSGQLFNVSGNGSIGRNGGTDNCNPGSTCYTNISGSLHNLYYNAKDNLEKAPYDLSLAEKNYFEFTKGKDNYNLMIFDRFATTAEEIKQNSIEKQQHFMTDLMQLLRQYNSEKISSDRAEQLLRDRYLQNKKIKNLFNRYKGIIQTSERKYLYENKDIDTLYLYRRVMVFIYYSIIILYLIFGNFISDKQYTNFGTWMVIIIALLIPIILNIIVKWLFIIKEYIVFWLSDRRYKDVYSDFSETTDQFKTPPSLSFTPS